MPDLSAWESDSAAAPVLLEIRRGRWRKARDAAKDLCRKDKIHYLPLLVEANAGLAGDLLGRGLIQDAATVLEYLKTIAPPEVMAALHAKQTESEAEAALVRATGGKKVELALWTLVEEASRGIDAGQEAPPAAVRAADFLVTSAYVPPDPRQPAAVELLAVQAAVLATGEGRWEAAREKLQGLPRRSLFQPWRLFLRGVRHAHHREAAEAQRCFEALPPGSGTARAAGLYRDLMGLPATADHPPPEADLPILTAMAGLEPRWNAPLAAAQRHWNRGKLPQAYEALAKPLAAHFPTEEPGFGAVLTDLVLASCAGKSPLPHAAQQDLVSSLLDHYYEHQFRSDQEEAFVIRFFLHEDGHSLSGENLEVYGKELTAVWMRMHIHDPIRESALWTMLAENLQVPRPGGGMHPPTPEDEPVLRRFYERAAALDPEDAAPSVRLARFFRACGNLSAYNSQLTALTKRFPGDKTVLILGAEEAARRKSYPKALQALRLAREADPVDAAAAALMVRVLQEQAVALAKKKQLVPETLWQEMEPLLLDLPSLPGDPSTPIPFDRLRWTARTLRGLLEKGSWPGEAARLAPGGWAHQFLDRVLQWRHGLAKSDSTPDMPARWLDLRWMQHLAHWDAGVADLPWKDQARLGEIMTRCVGHLGKSGAAAQDPAGLLEVVAYFQKLYQLNQPGSGIGDDACFALVRIMGAAAAKKQCPYQIRLGAIILPEHPAPHAAYLPDLEAILREANARGDSRTAEITSYFLNLARAAVARVPEAGSGSPADPAGNTPSGWETEGGEFEVYPDGETPEMLALVRLIAAMFKLFPKSRIREVQRAMEAAGMERESWRIAEKLGRLMAPDLSREQAAAIIESGGNTTPLLPGPFSEPEPRPGRTAPRKLPSRPDPFQPELF